MRDSYKNLDLQGQTINGFRIGPMIGYGGFSIVHRCLHIESSTHCAVKVMDMTEDGGSGSYEIMDELHLTHNLRATGGPFVTFMSSYEKENFCYMFMELAEGGEFNAYFDAIRRRGEPINEEDFADIMLDVFDGLEILHQQGYAHRDIKPNNILMTSQPYKNGTRALIGDFGLAQRLRRNNTRKQQGHSFRAQLGTVWYWAPEIVTGDGWYGSSADIWATGVSMWQALFNELPIGVLSGETLSVQDEKYKIALTRCPNNWVDSGEWQYAHRVSEDLWDFLKGVLCVNKYERLTATQALSHPFLLAARARRDLALDLQEQKDEEEDKKQEKEQVELKEEPEVKIKKEQEEESLEVEAPLPSAFSISPEIEISPDDQQEPRAPPVSDEGPDHPVIDNQSIPVPQQEAYAIPLELMEEAHRALTPKSAKARRARTDLIGPVKKNATIRKRTKHQVTPKLHRTRGVVRREAEAFFAPIAPEPIAVTQPAAVVPSASKGRKAAGKAKRVRKILQQAALPAAQAGGKTARAVRAEKRAARKEGIEKRRAGDGVPKE